MIKFSILVPVYNVSNFLHQCMDSIIGQTYSNIELICIDDGSTDGSGEILDAYAEKDGRITIIHKQNTGYGHSLNLALSQATGDYIGIVESDDYIAEDMYERMAQVLEREHETLDVVKASYFHISQFLCERQNLFEGNKCNEVISPKEYKGLFSMPCSIWSAVYRREFLKEKNIKFLETPGASYQDTAFAFKVWVMAEKVFLLDEALLYYRVDNADSSVKSEVKIYSVCEEVREIERYIKERNLDSLFVEGVKGVYIYRTYMWNYYRLHLSGRVAFWGEILREFRELQKSASFKEEYWTTESWQGINRILESPEHFFWDSNDAILELELDKNTIKREVYAGAIADYLKKQENIIIYGAGVYGKFVFQYLKKLDLGNSIRCFAVTKTEDALLQIEGLEVCEIGQLQKWKKNALVIVAVTRAKQGAILQVLKKLEFKRVLRVDKEFRQLLEEQSDVQL